MSDSNAGRSPDDLSLRDEIEARPSTVAVSMFLFVLHALAMPLRMAWIIAKVTWLMVWILFDAAKIYIPTVLMSPYHAYKMTMLGHQKDMIIYVTRQMTKHLMKKGF